jgi:hypothetical protein
MIRQFYHSHTSFAAQRPESINYRLVILSSADRFQVDDYCLNVN